MNSELAFRRIAEALLVEYTSVYYVNAETEEYECYSSDRDFNSLKIENRGENFFENMVKDVDKVVAEEDRALVVGELSRERVTESIAMGERKVIPYRLIINGETVHFSLQLIRGKKEAGEDYFIMGVKNVDAEVKHRLAEERSEKEKEVFNHIAQSLAYHYDTLYYVDAETNHYLEFSSTDTYKSLGVPTEGDDFFEESKENIPRVVHPEDVSLVMFIIQKDALISNLRNSNTFSITYRLRIGGEIRYTRFSSIWAADRKHIIIGIENIDDEMKKHLNLKEQAEKGTTFGHIAESLAGQYDTIYYVDSKNNSYIEFASSDIYKGLEVPGKGEDFFEESKKNIQRVIHEDDRERISNLLTKSNMIATLKEEKRYTADYRLHLGNGYKYTRLSVIWASDRRHIIVGVENIDELVSRELEKQRLEQQNVTYNQIATSLAKRYDSIYYVSTETGHYTQYSATNEYKQLNIEANGHDFFGDTARNIENVIYEEDKEIVLEAMKKDILISNLQGNKTFSLTYRLLLKGEPSYVQLRAVWAEDKEHLIIGIANVDDEVRKENEHVKALRNANEKAARDELTGIRNKNAYQEYEIRLQNEYVKERKSFGVIVCDVNGLKIVNDTLGHKAGDEYIRSACHLICTTFTHSPVFRIGGDEFVVVLLGEDFANRNELLESFRKQVLENQESGKVIVATGMAVLRADEDTKVNDVFSRADALMYENKKQLKGARI